MTDKIMCKISTQICPFTSNKLIKMILHGKKKTAIYFFPDMWAHLYPFHILYKIICKFVLGKGICSKRTHCHNL